MTRLLNTLLCLIRYPLVVLAWWALWRPGVPEYDLHSGFIGWMLEKGYARLEDGQLVATGGVLTAEEYNKIIRMGFGDDRTK